MIEQTTSQPEQKPAEDVAKPSLEDLYAEYDVSPKTETKVAPSEREQRPAIEPAATKVNEAAILRELRADREERKAERQRRQVEKDEADFKSAVAALGKKADLEGKDLMIRGFLLAKAGEDARLRALWDNREKTPEAWHKALLLLADDVRKEFEVPNPQLEENQRAMDESQRSAGAAPPQKGPADKVMQMNDAEFGQFWLRLARGG